MILTEKQPKYQHYKYEYLTGEGIIPSDQSRIIEQAKFTYFPLSKVFEKQIKTIEDQGEKQIKTLEKHGDQLVKYKKKRVFGVLKTKRNV